MRMDPDLARADWAEQRRHRIESECLGELQFVLSTNAAKLSDVERTVVGARYPPSAKDRNVRRKTFKQIGALIGKSTEGARQIHHRALEKLRAVLERRYAALTARRC